MQLAKMVAPEERGAPAVAMARKDRTCPLTLQEEEECKKINNTYIYMYYLLAAAWKDRTSDLTLYRPITKRTLYL